MRDYDEGLCDAIAESIDSLIDKIDSQLGLWV